MNTGCGEMDFDKLINEDIQEEIVDGYGKYFNPYGVLLYDGFFKNGKPHGQCKYYVCGVLDYDGEWKDGMFNGHGKLYEEDTYYEGEFKNGLYHGKGTIYYNNGTSKLEGNFKKGLVHGFATKFYDNGNIEYEGEFSNGKYSGKGKLYDKSGTLVNDGEFLNGNFIDEKMMNKDILKAFSIMKYIETRGEVCETCIKEIVKGITRKKQLCDIIINTLKDVNIPRALLVLAKAYDNKGVAYRKNYIECLEKFLSYDNLKLSDFGDSNMIMDGNLYRVVKDYEKDKQLIERHIEYLKKQLKIQLINSYKKEKMFDKSIELAHEDINSENNDYRTYVSIAEIFIKKKEYIKAEENLKKAIALVEDEERLNKKSYIKNSKADLIHQKLAEVYLKQYNARTALEYLESLNETPVLKSIKEVFRKKHKN